MRFTPTSLDGVVLIEPVVFEDARGFFMVSWQAQEFAQAGIDAHFVQDNHSASSQWVLRGLHYQLRRPQGKLVRVIQGEVFDVAVDVRRSSRTFGQWTGTHLSAQNRQMLWIPPGFAHGFIVLSEHAEFTYKCTDYYDPSAQRSILWSDPVLGIPWPVATGIEPGLSAKDRDAPGLNDAECYP